ncbi:hypothetical protein AB0I28_05965 [Phytomonospora sp. NPDC050363]|uniref:hypothetical protein n=1 Tax=Phytomonospora sp. NPDC050363 TaxID=3155642 RepID=UPI0033C82C42
MTRPGRRESEIDPEESPLHRFAHELRALRRRTGAGSYQDLGRHTRQIGCPFSASTLRNAASGALLPTAAVTAAFVRACMRHARHHRTELADPAVLGLDTDDLVADWVRRRDDLAAILDPARPPADAAPSDALPDPPARRFSRRMTALTAAVTATAVAVLTVVIITVVLTGDGDDAGADADGPPAAVTSLPPELESGHCRGAFGKQFAAVNPCVKATDGGLEIVVHVTSLEAAPEIAIHLWLHDATTDTRLTGTLHHCQAAFTAPDQDSTCGPVTLRPEPGHRYFAAASAEPGVQPWPTLWRDPDTTGLTSPVVTWPADGPP